MFKQTSPSILCVLLLVTLCLGAVAAAVEPIAIFWSNKNHHSRCQRVVVNFADGTTKSIKVKINQSHVVEPMDPATVKRVSVFWKGATQIFDVKPTDFANDRRAKNFAAAQLYLNTTAEEVYSRRKEITNY